MIKYLAYFLIFILDLALIYLFIIDWRIALVALLVLLLPLITLKKKLRLTHRFQNGN